MRLAVPSSSVVRVRSAGRPRGAARVRWVRRLAAVATVVAAGVLCGAVPVGASLPQLTMTGSSFAGVAIEQWMGNFNEIDGGNVDFTVSSSIIGMNNFCQTTTEVGATDISYDTGQSNCSPSQVPYSFQYMPDVAGGLSFEYNLHGPNGRRITNLVLSAPVLEGIFTGAITDWNDPTIQALNPSVELPAERIVPYYRSDPCGENYLLSDYFLTVDPGLIGDFQKFADVPQIYTAADPVGASATWVAFTNGAQDDKEFPNATSLFAANGADPASQDPLHQEGGISYVEYAYAKSVGLPVASVVNSAGYAVQPTAYNVATALTTAILYSDLTQNLSNVYTNPDPDAYPISAYSYFLAQCVPSQAAAQNFACDGSGTVTMSAAQGAEMAKFIEFVACQGQESMVGLGYSPIPVNLVDDDFDAAGRLPGGSTPSAPTASTCPNPYLTGALQPVGQPQVTNAAPPSTQQVAPGAVAAGHGGSSSSSSAAGRSGGSTGGGGGGATATGGTSGTSGTGGTSTGGKGGSGTAAGAVAEGADAFKVGTAVGGTTASGAPPIYQRQDGLEAAASFGLRGWSAGRVALWCCLLLALLAVPTVGLVARRRRMAEGRPGPDPGAGA